MSTSKLSPSIIALRQGPAGPTMAFPVFETLTGLNDIATIWINSLIYALKYHSSYDVDLLNKHIEILQNGSAGRSRLLLKKCAIFHASYNSIYTGRQLEFIQN